MCDRKRAAPRGPSRLALVLLGATVIGATVILGAGCAISQRETAPLGIVPSTVAPASTSPELPSVEAARLNVELAQLRERVDSFTYTIGILVAVLAVVLVLGGLTSTASWFTYERRSKELHGFLVAGETRAQSRESYTFEQSKQTIDLVNSTLELARDASRNAAQALEQSARNQLDELDRQAATTVAPALKEWRSLVTVPGRTAPLRALASQLNLFESIRLVLAQGLQPSPEATFIRGMEGYLAEDFDRALELWGRVVVDGRASNELKILAHYWLGYVNDNRGRYDDAVQSFDSGVAIYQRSDPTNARKYELKRILLESRFFDAPRFTPQELLPQFAALLDELDNEIENRHLPGVEEVKRMRTHLLVTYGNVYFDCAASTTSREAKAALLDKATGLYQRAEPEKTEEAKYARFGLAESRHHLGNLRNDEDLKRSSHEMFRTQVLRDATDELQRRQERRTQIRALTAQLVCHIRLGDEHREQAEAVKTQIDARLGELDERLTVFSLMQFRNVAQDQFRKDLDKLLERTS